MTVAQKERQVMTASGINVVAGIWLILAPFILDYVPREAWWNDILVGLAVLILAGSRFGAPRSPGPSWVNVILGIWLILAPFVLGYADMTTPLWNDIILGIIVAASAGWSAAVTPRRTHVPVH